MLEDIITKLMDLSIVIKYKKVFIFGCGKGGKLTSVALKNLGIEPSGFVDNDANKVGMDLNGIPIMSPDNLASESADQIIILVASIFYEEIMGQLSKMEFREEVHFFQILSESCGFNESTRSDRVINGVRIGKYSYGYERLCYKDTLIESIGAFCSINNTVEIGVNHPTEYITTHPFFYLGGSELLGAERVPSLLEDQDIVNVWEISKNGKIIIGNDVWIGANVVLLPSIKIGNGAIIGAGAIVTKDVPDYAIVVGAPAKVKRYRFNSDEIDLLNRIQWWNWSDEKIKDNAHYFSKNTNFFERFA